ncbi:MAG: HAD family phosphatase [Nanoarchaeota archaeon]|nr:HAD family phosphatase [Nanoarchaeota archaeon]
MKSIVFDVDGCIVRLDNGLYTVQKSDLLKVFEKAEQHGITFHLNSARIFESLKLVYNDLGLKGIMIVENGAYSYNPKTKELKNNGCKKFDVNKLLNVLKLANKQVSALNFDDLFMRPEKIINEYSGKHLFYNSKQQYSQLVCFRNVGQTIEYMHEEIDLIKNTVKQAFPNFNVEIFKDICAVGILPKNLSKANFMNTLEKPIASFGDSLADVKMFEVSNYCGCPANAKPEVKQKVKELDGYICKKNVSEGVIEFIEHIISNT